MDNVHPCFGKWTTQSSNKCEQCGVQLKCYSKMKENEKMQEQREKLEALKEIPWYKRNKGEGDTVTYGVCEKCG